MDLGQFPKPNLPPRPLLIGTAIAAVAAAGISLTCCCSAYSWLFRGSPEERFLVTKQIGPLDDDVRPYASPRAAIVAAYIRDYENDPASVQIVEIRAMDEKEMVWGVWYRANNEQNAFVRRTRVVWFAKDESGNIDRRRIDNSIPMDPEDVWDASQ